MNEDNSHNIQRSILEKIENGEIKMKPRIYFVLQLILVVLLSAIIFIISVFLISYIIFSLKTGGYIQLLNFGARGLYQFLLLFPWFVLVIDILFLVLLDTIIKRFRFGYNNPIIYLFSGSLLTITAVASLLNLTSFHGYMMVRAQQNKLPLAGTLYKGVTVSDTKRGVFRGEVIALNGNTFTLKTYMPHESAPVAITIVFPTNVSTTSFLKIGDRVFVAGDLKDDEVKAYGIGKLSTK